MVAGGEAKAKGMGDEVVEIDSLEKSLLEENNEGEEAVLYSASFREMEQNFVKYQTVQWVLYSLFADNSMGHWAPHVALYPCKEVTRPVPFPCFGVLKKEKHVYCILWQMSWLSKAVMMRLSNMRNEIVSRQVSTLEDAPHLMLSPSKSLRHDSTPPGELLLLQKLEEVGTSVKRIQTLFEEQQSQTTESID
ncbi:hypothetical protein SESBI_03946 [Sesbania bispinosa]|nr:hypothetical protein SESBI_03946 [Sesbania bispinosa]